MTSFNTDDIVAVIGAGAMGAGIAQVAAQAGHPVLLFDAMEGAAEKGRSGIIAQLKRLVEKGRMTAETAREIESRLQAVPSLQALAPARLVIEAIVEKLDIKKKVFGDLEGIVAEDAILATNTSSLSVTAIGQGLAHPDRLAGLHFFNPAPLMALVEVVSGLATGPAIVDQLVDLAHAWGKKAVRCRSTPGFIVNRVARPFYAEGLRLLEEGAADAATIDALLREAGGFRMGPFELMDLIGHDVNFAVTRSVFDAYFGDPRFRPSLTQQELVAAGWLGRKSGRGFYDYAAGAERPAPASLGAGKPLDTIVIEGDLGPAESIVALLTEKGVKVDRFPGEGLVRLDGATLALTDGRTATARVAQGGAREMILFDLALDYKPGARVAMTKADQASVESFANAASLFDGIGMTVSPVDDVPGLVVMRTVAMLANEAADACLQGVASAEDIDRAMMAGVNYPRGPLDWADAIGPARVLDVLANLQDAYGDDRYRPSQLLARRVAAHSTFHDPGK